MVGTKRSAKYEKFLDNDLAEVGVECWSIKNLLKQYPVEQVILKNDDGIWKYYYSMYDLTWEQLIEAIRKNPNDASLYYYLGVVTQSENPAKAHRYYKKYYELDSEGFWVTNSFLTKLKEFEDIVGFENKMLRELSNIPPNSPDRATVYRTLGQLYMENLDYGKAGDYFDKAKTILEIDKDSLGIERLEKSKEELQLRMGGKYVDLLDELESLSKDK